MQPAYSRNAAVHGNRFSGALHRSACAATYISTLYHLMAKQCSVWLVQVTLQCNMLQHAVPASWHEPKNALYRLLCSAACFNTLCLPHVLQLAVPPSWQKHSGVLYTLGFCTGCLVQHVSSPYTSLKPKIVKKSQKTCWCFVQVALCCRVFPHAVPPWLQQQGGDAASSATSQLCLAHL